MQITTTKTQPSQNITIIKETQFSHKPAIQNKIDFVTPPFISKPYKSTTPDPIDTSTPTINENQSKQNPSKEILTPKTYKKKKNCQTRDNTQHRTQSDTKTCKIELQRYRIPQQCNR